MKKIFPLFIFLIAFHCDAQPTFFKTYGSTNKEEGKCLELCSDGGFIIGADVTLIPPAPDSSNILIVRTNSMGDTLWTRIINSGENDFCVKVIETSDLGFAVLANRVNSSNNSKIILMKLNSSGIIQWSKTYMKLVLGCTGRTIIEKIQGGYMISGFKSDTCRGGLLINTNPVGDTIWTKNEGALSFNSLTIHDVKQLADSSFVILAALYNLNIFYPRLLRLDAAGNILYSNQYDDLSFDDGITSASSYMQESNSFALAGSGRTNASNRFVVKFDSLFNIQWSQKFVMPMNKISNVIQTQDSGFVFIADLLLNQVQQSNHTCYMVKTNSSGIVSWAKEFQHGSLRSPHSLLLTPDNGIAFCGFFMDTLFSNNKDLLLIKTDANGNIPCDGIAASVTNASILFATDTNSYNIGGGLFMTTSSFTTQGGIPINNICFTTSESENFSELISDFHASTNPTYNEFLLSISNTIKPNTTASIYNFLGTEVLTVAVTNSQTGINISTLPAGVYFVSVKEGERSLGVKKIVKI